MNHIMVPYIDYIGAKLFTDTYKSDVVQALSQSPPINLLIRDIAQELANKDQKSIDFHIKALKLQAAQTVQNMIANVSSTWATRVFGYSVKTMLGRMYHHGVHVRESEIERLRLVATDAAKQGVPLIFLPCHKSHVDYLVVSYILYSVGIALPHIAAGDNLNLPGLGAFLRHGGAFFIRRKWGHDPLYTLIMKEYIIYLMEHGYNIEAFVEGTRSRTGKLLRPKFGVLKICMDAVFSGRVKDAIIIPVSIGYDKVIETPSYVDEMLGRPKEKESLGKLVNSGFNLLQLKWGRIDVRFGEAISMHKFIKDTQPDKASTSVMHPKVLQAMGYHILSSINNISVIMPTGLVGTVLLTLRGRGVGRNELIRKVVTLRNEIVKRGGSVAEVESSAYADVVDRAIKVLGDLVGRRQDTLEPVYYPILRFPLSFYRNQTIHYFVHEAILCVAMYSTIKRGGDIHAQRIPIASRLTEDVAFISRLLKFEFVYQGQGLEKNLQYTVDRLLKGNVVEVGSENDAQWITLSQNERDIGRETYDFYCFLLWPFLETYWLAAVSLYTLLPESADTHVMYWVEEKLFMKRCQVFGKTLYYEGDVSYFEAINQETLGNAMLRLKEMGMINVFDGPKPPSERFSGTGSRWICLSAAWTPTERLPELAYSDIETHLKRKKKDHSENPWSELNMTQVSKDSVPDDFGFQNWYRIRPKGRLWDFCEAIGRFRREGKNRRDTSTVATRVLRLARHAEEYGEKPKARKQLASTKSDHKL